MTNREWLATLSTEDWWKTVYWLIFDYGMGYTDTRIAVMNWLDEKHTQLLERSETMDREQVMSWLEGLSQDDWRLFHSDSEVSNIAKYALALLKEQGEKTAGANKIPLKW